MLSQQSADGQLNISGMDCLLVFPSYLVYNIWLYFTFKASETTCLMIMELSQAPGFAFSPLYLNSPRPEYILKTLFLCMRKSTKCSC